MSKAKRYKEPKLLKTVLIILILMLIASVGALIFQPDVQTRIASLAKSDVKKYEAASDYVKDTFTRDNTKYLPIRISQRGQTISKEDIKRDFAKDGIPVKSFSPDVEPIKNGTKVMTDNGEYTVLLYGDVNCDGEIDVLDAQDIIWHIVRKGDYTLTGIRRIVANVDDPNVDEVDIYDASRIVAFILGKSGLIDVLPESDIKNDHDKPVIKLEENGEIIKLKVSTKDKPTTFDLFSGVTATDNVDYNIRSKVYSTGYLDLEEPGRYTINYDVVDSNGNKADTVSRKIEVVNYVEDIIIEEMPTKKEFANGEKLDKNTMAGMKLIAKMAYDDGREREISLEDVTFSPSIIDIEGNETVQKEIYITYHDNNIDEDTTKALTITVTPHKPVYEVNGEFAYGIELGENNYVMPEIRAFEDEEPKTELPVKYYVKIIKNGITEEIKECANTSEVENLIVGEKNTVYEITYNAVSDRYGSENPIKVTVNTIDTINRIEIDKEKTLASLKKNYIEEQYIDLDGLVLKATTKSGEVETIFYNNEKANFILSEDKAVFGTNGTQIITLKYKREYPLKDKERTYDVVDSENELTLTVKKKLATIEEVTVTSDDVEVMPSDTGDIYDTVFRIRLKSPADEEDITTTNTRITITADDENNNGSTKKAWIDKAKDKAGNIIQGQVDLFVAVTKVGTYKINVIPYTLTEEQKDTYQFTYIAEKHMTPDSVKMTGFKKTVKNDAGESTEVSAEDPNFKVKTGDTIYTDIMFQKSVENEDLGIRTKVPVDVYPPSIDKLIAIVKKGSIADVLVAGADGDYTYSFSEPDENERVRLEITINKELDESSKGNIGQRIKVEIGLDNKPLVTNGGNNTATIYNKSRYTLTVGTSGDGTENTVSIEMKADNYKNYSANSNIIAVSKVQDGGVESNNYYTILPISLKDQYGAASITGKIFKDKISMLTESKAGVISSANLVDMIPVAKDGINYIKQDVDDNSIVIDKIGVAISNAVTDKTKLTELQNSVMKISFVNESKDKVVTNMSPLTVYTKPSSTVEADWKDVGTVTCFDEKLVATLTTKNTDLSFLTGNEVAIKVSKDGVGEIDAVYGKYNLSTDAQFGYEVEEDTSTKGVVKLTVWSKYMGGYTITPYIKGTKFEDTRGNSTKITFAHDTKINKVLIKNSDDKASGELLTGNIVSDKVTVPRGGSKVVYLKYYHDYGNGNKYEITGVFGKDVTILLNDPTGNSWRNVSSLGTDPEKMNWENSNLWNVAPRKDTLPLETNREVTDDGKWQIESIGETQERALNNIRIYAGGKTSGPLTLTVKISDDKKTAAYRPEGFSFTVGEPEKVTLQVGNSDNIETITAYQADPKLTAVATFPNSEEPTRRDSLYVLDDGTLIYKWDVDADYCLYYTLVSVKSSNPLVQSFISDSLADKKDKNKLTFIDSDRDKGAPANTINLAKFKVTRNGSSYSIIMNSSQDELTHVGIAISKYDIDFEEKLDGKNEVDIIDTYVYYGSDAKYKTIKIKAVKPAEPSTVSDDPVSDPEPDEETSTPEKDSKPTDVTTTSKPEENPTSSVEPKASATVPSPSPSASASLSSEPEE